MNRQEIEKKLDQAGVNFDRLTFHKDGSITVKIQYFYTFGKSVRTYTERLLKAFPEAKILQEEDHWNPWPKRSFWLIKFQP